MFSQVSKKCKDLIRLYPTIRYLEHIVYLCGNILYISAGRLLPAGMLERWPHVCHVKIMFGLLPTCCFVSTQNEFDELEMPCKINSTQILNPHLFKEYQTLL